mmetsp:Transcript_6397/g.18440  ORF Transcript_6397/g.18440 Transcript_6397/m.18440 type:complete len:277 (-) Transcript_6397:1656-2486(-)
MISFLSLLLVASLPLVLLVYRHLCLYLVHRLTLCFVDERLLVRLPKGSCLPTRLGRDGVDGGDEGKTEGLCSHGAAHDGSGVLDKTVLVGNVSREGERRHGHAHDPRQSGGRVRGDTTTVHTSECPFARWVLGRRRCRQNHVAETPHAELHDAVVKDGDLHCRGLAMLGHRALPVPLATRIGERPLPLAAAPPVGGQVPVAPRDIIHVGRLGRIPKLLILLGRRRFLQDVLERDDLVQVGPPAHTRPRRRGRLGRHGAPTGHGRWRERGEWHRVGA